ncbi:hypothetical protein M569_12978, partial [Genlisea aurea]
VGINPKNVVNPMYRLDQQIQTYENQIQPLRSEDRWPLAPFLLVQDPTHKKDVCPGRQQSKRFPMAMDFQGRNYGRRKGR